MWTLLWIALVAGALAVFFQLARSLWRKAVAVLTELGAASERLAAVSGVLESINASPAPAEPLAVFADPLRLRQERFLARRGPTTARNPPRTGASG